MSATEENVNISTETATADSAENKKISSGPIAVLKVVIPVVVIILCMVIAGFMLNSAIKNNSYIDGRFILAGNDTQNFIDIDSDGEFQLVSSSSAKKGKWTLQAGVMTFSMSDGETVNGEFVDRKYIVMKDSNFLSGEIPDGDTIDAEVVSAEGVAYVFDADGKIYIKEDGRNVEAGSYIIDGYFIVVTNEEESVTYFKCKDGITPLYYQAS